MADIAKVLEQREIVQINLANDNLINLANDKAINPDNGKLINFDNDI